MTRLNTQESLYDLLEAYERRLALLERAVFLTGRDVGDVVSAGENFNNLNVTGTLGVPGQISGNPSGSRLNVSGGSGGTTGIVEVNNQLSVATPTSTMAFDSFPTPGAGSIYAEGGLVMPERGDPGTPASNTARIYARDSVGKTQLVVKFQSGNAQVISAEP